MQEFKLTIAVPPKDLVITQGHPVPLAPHGVRWSESCLGKMAKELGVYVIHHADKMKYVGKTNAPGMSFGMRLRREFQETASGGKHVYPRLSQLARPPEIRVSFFPIDEVQKLMSPQGFTLNPFQAIEILEAVLVQVYEPEFQQHQLALTGEATLRLITGASQEPLQKLEELNGRLFKTAALSPMPRELRRVVTRRNTANPASYYYPILASGMLTCITETGQERDLEFPTGMFIDLLD